MRRNPKEIPLKYPLTTWLPPKVCVALSGGEDSTAAWQVLRLGPYRHRCKVTHIVHVNHSTRDADYTETQVLKAGESLDVEVKTYKLDKASEGVWSRQRRDIYEAQDVPVVVGHHLDDAVTWYTMQVLKGNVRQSRYMPPTKGNVLRPFMLFPKAHLFMAGWHRWDDFPYQLPTHDASNDNPRANTRNGIRRMLEWAPGQANPTNHISKTYRRYISNGYSF